MAFAFRVDASQVRQWAAATNASIAPFHAELTKATVTAALEGQVVAKQRTPIFMGLLVNSIQVASPVIVKTPDSFNVFSEVYTDRPYAEPVEFGRRAGAKAPPYAAIERWVRLKMDRGQLAAHLPIRRKKKATRKREYSGKAKTIRRITFAVMRAISKRGIPPTHFMETGFERAKVVLQTLVDEITTRWVKRLGGP